MRAVRAMRARTASYARTVRGLEAVADRVFQIETVASGFSTPALYEQTATRPAHPRVTVSTLAVRRLCGPGSYSPKINKTMDQRWVTRWR